MESCACNHATNERSVNCSRAGQGLPLTEDVRNVAYTLQLPGAEAAALLAMTPYHWKATASQRTQLAAEPCVDVDVDITVARYRLP